MKKNYNPAVIFFPLGYLLIMGMFGVLIGYPVYSALEGDYPLEKITSKLTLLLLVLSIYPLSKLLNYRRDDYGLQAPFPALFKPATIGFLAGLAILAVVIATELTLEIRLPDPSLTFSVIWLIQLAAKALISGILVGLIEETLFRGLLFRFILDRSSLFTAITLSAFFYAALHFLQSGIDLSPGETNLLTGFKLVALSFANLTNPEIFDSMLALFFVGVLLALVRHYGGSLWVCIGMHASWVFMIKITKSMTDGNLESPWHFLVGNYDGIIGHLTSAWLAIVILIYLMFFKEKNSPKTT